MAQDMNNSELSGTSRDDINRGNIETEINENNELDNNRPPPPVGQMNYSTEDEEDVDIAAQEIEPALVTISNVSPTPSQSAMVEATSEDDCNSEPDETIYERIAGLSEMFPDSVRHYAHKMTRLTRLSVRRFYAIACKTTWVVFSSAVILIAPIAFESERAQMQEFQKSHEKQILLGPSSVIQQQQLQQPQPRRINKTEG